MIKELDVDNKKGAELAVSLIGQRLATKFDGKFDVIYGLCEPLKIENAQGKYDTLPHAIGGDGQYIDVMTDDKVSTVWFDLRSDIESKSYHKYIEYIGDIGCVFQINLDQERFGEYSKTTKHLIADQILHQLTFETNELIAQAIRFSLAAKSPTFGFAN
jgi:hypothetical protein